MNRDQFEGKWKEYRGKIKEKWGKLTDNDIAQINGKYDQLMGSLQKRYGYHKEQAEKEFNSWNWGSEKNASHMHQEHGSKKQDFKESGHRNDSNFNRENNRGMKDKVNHKGQDHKSDKHSHQKGQNHFDQEKKRKAG